MPKVPLSAAAYMLSASNNSSENQKQHRYTPRVQSVCARPKQGGNRHVSERHSRSAAVLTLSATAFAQQLGTADEAKGMLLKAVAALKADRDVTLGMINKGEGGFRDRDLYVFCVRVSDGKQLASGAVIPPIGTDQRTLKDSTGKAFGLELYAAGQKPEGEITEVSYMFPKPGTTAPPVSKVSFVTRVGDLGCGVGYYK